MRGAYTQASAQGPCAASDDQVDTGGAEAAHKARGKVVVLVEWCKGCSFCVRFCPSGCLELSQDFNGKGYHYPVVVRPERCSGCNLCGLYCPDFAIFGEKISQGHLNFGRPLTPKSEVRSPKSEVNGGVP